MPRFLQRVCVPAISIVGLCAANVLAQQRERGSISAADVEESTRAVSLFDGKSLDGWEGDPKHWRVAGGAIVGEIPPGQQLSRNTWIIWRAGELRDFDLRLKFKLTGAPGANSGIQIRSQAKDTQHVSGYQADLDMGREWLGRIYDEHGRALLVERGSRVHLDAEGQRTVEAFAPPESFAVLFREGEWNDYRIVAIGSRMAVFINGTLFSELFDHQAGEQDAKGSLALQLHSGPETLIQFRDITLEELSADDSRLGEPSLPRSAEPEPSAAEPEPSAAEPIDSDGAATNPGSAIRSTYNPILRHLVPNPVMAVAQPGQGIKTIERMFVPEGFSVDVIAAEPRLHQPIAFTFDAKGRLWVVEGHSYPQKRPEGEGLDRILIFSDIDGDGEFEDRKVFTEGLNLVSGLQVGHGGVWVGAAPHLLFIPDRNGDDVPDEEPKILLDGFGFADTHETLNSFLWGPDGWLYGNQGVFNDSRVGPPGAPHRQRQRLSAGVWRYHPTRHVFEVFAQGGSNQWGLDYDWHGQLFMTHCRSAHGQGSTTHVVQGGHYWNQVNSGYAPYISPAPIDGMPWMKNFMLASARYGHGEGGAGKPGSRDVYGGHSHVGTLIYLGNNWPAEYHNHLFTHNLHGHQINHQINVRQAGGYNTQHAGYDVLLCADEQYIGVQLHCGPDGAVYFSDWYDPRHCHSPNPEQWDRGNGRIYRMKYDANYQPGVVDYSRATLDELVAAQMHPSAWHARTARLVLSERAANGFISPGTAPNLLDIAKHHPNATRRLRALWSLNAIGAIDRDVVARMLQDESEYVRAWAVQLAVEILPSRSLTSLLVPQVEAEYSLFVRRYLASAIQRVPADLGWTLAETLSMQAENGSDRELPLLVWYGLAELMNDDLPRAIDLSAATPVDPIRDYVSWYAAKLSDAGRTAVARQLVTAERGDRLRLLTLFDAAVGGMRGLTEPAGWSNVAAELYESSRTRRAAERIGAAFGDRALFARARRQLDDDASNDDTKRHALEILANDGSVENLPLLLDELDNESLAVFVILMLKPYNDPSVADALVSRLPDWQRPTEEAALEVLCSRSNWASRLLDAIAAGEIDKDRLSAFYARQISNLGDSQLNERLSRLWGRLGQSSQERMAEIKELSASYKTAPIWAYDRNAGQAHFKKLCANCHKPDDLGNRLAPKLEGTRAKGIDYIVENILDPNAVIGKDFQARIILTDRGRYVTGLVIEDTDSAITIATGTSTETVARDDIEEMSISHNSFMPEDLLTPLSDREKIELLKYVLAL